MKSVNLFLILGIVAGLILISAVSSSYDIEAKKDKDKDPTPKVFMDCNDVCWDKCEQKYVTHDIPDKCKDKWVKK